jgi:hypothetical protein
MRSRLAFPVGDCVADRHCEPEADRTICVPTFGETVILLIPDCAHVYYSTPDTNYGNATTIRVAWATGHHWNAFLYVDLSAYAGRSCFSARVWVYNDGALDDVDVLIYRVLAQWAENQVTWNNRLTGVPWTTPGGDFASTPEDTVHVTALGWYSFDVTALVNAWLAGTLPNYGVVFHIPVPNSSLVDFWSDDWSVEPEKRPYLELILV